MLPMCNPLLYLHLPAMSSKNFPTNASSDEMRETEKRRSGSLRDVLFVAA